MLNIPPGRLHIWRASVDQPAAVRDRLAGVLSENEKERGARMVRRADRDRWSVARASLRIVLAKYVDADPRLLSIASEESGRPYLEDAAADIQFSVSHSDGLAVIAVSPGKRIGIDIESFRDVPEMETIVDDFFGEPEQGCLRSREGEERLHAFFLLWTRREAVAKATGTGLFEAFARFILPAPERDEAGFKVELPGSPADQPAYWWIRDLPKASGFAGALCTEGLNAEPSFCELQL